MRNVTDAADPGAGRATGEAPVIGPGELGLLPEAVVALVAGAGLCLAARNGALALLVVLAIVQAVFALAWIYGTSMPGPRGALVVAALAGAGADVAVSMFPHGRLGALLIVVGLAVPVMFAHQLIRGAARVQLVASLSASAVVVLGEAALPSLLQLRHEFTDPGVAGKVVSAAVAAIAAALVVGCFVDLVAPTPRFDAAVPRGLLAVVASAGVGAALGYLLLRSVLGFGGGAGAFLGAALGALAGLLAIATAFVQYTTPNAEGVRGRVRPVLAAVLPICLLAPVAYLLCLAVRS